MKENVVLKEVMYCFAHFGFQILMPGWKTTYHIPLGVSGLVWRNNVGGMRDKTGRHFVRFGVAGMPDITGVTSSGLFIGCEVKAPGNEPTEVQEWMHKNIRTMKGIVFTAHSYEECAAELTKHGFSRSR